MDHGGVDAVLGQEFGAGAGLRKRAVGHYYDAVGLFYGAEAVGYEEDGLVGGEALEGLVEGGFGFHVDLGGGFVEDDDGGVLEQGAGDGEALGLARAERHALVAHQGFEALRGGTGRSRGVRRP